MNKLLSALLTLAMVLSLSACGGGGIRASQDNLAALTGDAQWLEGTRFNPGVSQDELSDWVDGLGL